MQDPASNPAPDKGASGQGARIWALVWMIVSQLLGLVFSAVPVGFLVFGVLLNGSAGLKMDFWTTMYALPVLNILPMIAAWVAFARGKTRLALILTSVPLVLGCLQGGGLLGMMTGFIPTP